MYLVYYKGHILVRWMTCRLVWSCVKYTHFGMEFSLEAGCFEFLAVSRSTEASQLWIFQFSHLSWEGHSGKSRRKERGRSRRRSKGRKRQKKRKRTYSSGSGRTNNTFSDSDSSRDSRASITEKGIEIPFATSKTYESDVILKFRKKNAIRPPTGFSNKEELLFEITDCTNLGPEPGRSDPKLSQFLVPALNTKPARLKPLQPERCCLLIAVGCHPDFRIALIALLNGFPPAVSPRRFQYNLRLMSLLRRSNYSATLNLLGFSWWGMKFLRLMIAFASAVLLLLPAVLRPSSLFR